MLICPQCQFENPPSNHFCQQCGDSLTLKTCQDCGALVPFTALSCPQCHCLTGQVSWVVLAQISPPTRSPLAETGPEEPLLSFPFEDDFLDPDQRYRLLGLPDDPHRGLQSILFASGQRFFQGSVLDCQPLQQSEFARFLRQSSTILCEQQQPENQFNLWLAQQGGIPEIALPYLSLQKFLPILPMPSDAWQTGPWQVLLLPDRSPWPSLTDLMASQSVPILQILYWLNEMVTLWTALEPLDLTQSLFIPANFRVDEDQTLSLCQLYPPLDENSLTLKQLVQFWKEALLVPFPGEAIAPLVQLCDRILSEESITLADLRTQLKNLADSEQKLIPTHPYLLSEDLSEQIAESILFSRRDDPVAPGQSLYPQSLTAISEGQGDEMSTEVLPMRLFSLSEAGASECGQQRQHNEDYLGIDSQVNLQQNHLSKKIQAKGLYIVCDGMGGHAAGEVASALAVHTLRDYFQKQWQDNVLPSREVIKAGIWQANQKLYQMNQQNASIGVNRMGTTLVMLLLQDNTVAIAHVGDSRIYRVNRKWGLEQLTLDHEVGQKAIQSGLDPMVAYARPEAHQLTQALGPLNLEQVLPDVQYLDIQEDTIFLLCSDGISDNDLVETHWQTLLLPLLSSSAQLDLGIHQLLEFANQYNGHDNLTGILVRLKVRPHLKG